MTVKQLSSVEELNQFLQQRGKQLLFKHSTSCPVSAAAHQEFQLFAEETNMNAAIVLVIEDRPLSNHIAERLGIKHESPQIFYIENGDVRWNASHWKITKAALQEVVSE